MVLLVCDAITVSSMMAYMGQEIANITDIADMPRGGPDASWLDRLLQTDRLEYLDRDDVDDRVKSSVIEALDWMGVVLREHERNAEQALREVATVPDPRILELGAGHGSLSRKILEQHPTATVTVSDVNPQSVDSIAASDLGDIHVPRCGSSTRPQSTNPTAHSISRSLRCRSITCRPRWRRGSSQRAPGWPANF